jgi:hypothetical protein
LGPSSSWGCSSSAVLVVFLVLVLLAVEEKKLNLFPDLLPGEEDKSIFLPKKTWRKIIEAEYSKDSPRRAGMKWSREEAGTPSLGTKEEV